MARFLNRIPGPARWHRTDKGVIAPYLSRRLTHEEFKAHDLILNSEARPRFWIEAFEIQDDKCQFMGVVWSRYNDNPLPHQRQSHRYVWSFVNWRFEVRHHWVAHWNLSVRYWHSRGAAVAALFDMEEGRRALATLEREEAARKNTEASALDDFHL